MKFVRSAVSFASLFVPVLASLHAEDLSTQLMHCTCRLSDPHSAATAFVLSRPKPADPKQSEWILITAAHVLEGMKGEEASLLTHQKQPDGTYKKVHVPIKVRKDGKPRWVKHGEADVAAMRVALPPVIDMPRLPTELLASEELLKRYEIHPGDTVLCLGYPHRFEENHGGFPVLREGRISSYPLTPTRTTKTFHVSFNTFEGDSGGPVYLYDRNRLLENGKSEPVRLILGLVYGQHFIDEDIKTAYETRKTRVRLGLAIVIHAALIREAIGQIPPNGG
jgi:hypothetical protein